MPWASVHANVRLPLDLAGVPARAAQPRVREALAQVGLDGFGRCAAAHALGRHADARVDRTQPGDAAASCC